MRPAWRLTVAPEDEPITLAQAKRHLRVSELDVDEDGLIAGQIAGVRGEAELYLGCGLLTQTWTYVQDDWTDEISLPMAGRLQSVTVEYYDAAGNRQTLDPSAYLVDDVAEPGAVRRAPFQVWPALQPARAAAVVITYVVGWTDVAQIPPDVLNGLYLLLARRFVRRGDEAPDANAGALDCPAAEACLAKHRVFWRPPRVCVEA